MNRRTHRFALAAVLVAAAAALVSCGDDESATVTETVSVSTTTEAESSTQEESTATVEEADGEVPDADQSVTMLSGFTSPTGNIGCFIEPESVRCDIQDRDWEPPAAPADCQLDYGQGISLSAGAEADFVCAGDTALGAGEPLPYGTSIAAGLLRCESEQSGMTCRDVETGRGFTLSKDAYEIF